MTNKPLGRLERIELRDVWSSEASDFTPWLAQKENLQILADTLGMELELEAQERQVGPFRADILCKDIGTGGWVLIENQLERTDHNHLGQLLTYASGLDAATIVWVAANFTNEHRSTLDWLNGITDEKFRFFGLEIELWRIGESPAAPKFNIISKPNIWSRSIAKVTRAIDATELSDTRRLQRDYWEAFQAVLKSQGGPLSGNRTPQPQPWMGYAIGRYGFSLSAVMIRPRRQVRAELYISGERAKAFFHLLERQKDAIERELGYSLRWEELPAGRDSRIACYLDDADPDDKPDWPRQHEWLAKRLNEMRHVFAPRVQKLDADDWQSDTESAGAPP